MTRQPQQTFTVLEAYNLTCAQLQAEVVKDYERIDVRSFKSGKIYPLLWDKEFQFFKYSKKNDPIRLEADYLFDHLGRFRGISISTIKKW